MFKFNKFTLKQKSIHNKLSILFESKKIPNFLSCLNQRLCDKIKREEILLYIMQDKYSVKPDKEFRIHHTTLEKRISPDIPPKTEEKVDISSDGKEISPKSKFKPHKVVSYGKHSITEISTLKLKIHFMKASMKRKFMNKLCPRDYPYSVKSGYSGFSTYTFISNASFNAMNFITTQVLINALNLNISKSAGVLFSAGLNWAIKEGVGQTGSILFATKYSQIIERNAKAWRVSCAFLCSLGVLMEATTLLFPKYFLLIATSSNIIKLISINGIFFARTAIIENLAKENNIVDLTNKQALQNNISILLGNLIGFAFSFMIPLNSFGSVFTLLSLISIFNCYTAIKSIRYIDFNYFNAQRLCILSEEFLKNKNLLSPEEVSKMETIRYSKYKNLNFCCRSPENIIKSDNQLYLVQLFNIFREKNFFVIVKKKYSLLKMKTEYIISTFLRVNADNNDIFWAFLFTVRLNQLIENFKMHSKIISYPEITELIEENINYIDELDKKHLLEKLKNLGWILNFSHLEEKYSRYHLLYKNL